LVLCRFYASDQELKRLFNSVNGLVFPVSSRAAAVRLAKVTAGTPIVKLTTTTAAENKNTA
jgi:hypothetical protein